MKSFVEAFAKGWSHLLFVVSVALAESLFSCKASGAGPLIAVAVQAYELFVHNTLYT